MTEEMVGPAVKYGEVTYLESKKPRQLLIEYDVADDEQYAVIQAFLDANDKYLARRGEWLPSVDFPVGDWSERATERKGADRG